jgi:hypothetical protein
MGLVTQQHSTVSKTECSVAGDKTRLVHAVEDIIGYSWPLCPTVYGRLGHAPFPRGEEKRGKGSGKPGLSTIQLSSPMDTGYYAQAVQTT